MPGVDMNATYQLHLLREAFPRFHDEYRAFSHHRTSIPYEFHYNNGMFDGTDALALYCMVRHFRPRRIIEIGGGYSTMISARAALLNEETELIVIEPYPGETLRRGFPGYSALIDQRIQDVDRQWFSSLGDGDILFVDTTHVVRTGGDVNYIFLDLIPRLNEGVIVHVHDIFFPREYPKGWVIDRRIFWTEQYLLHAFLVFNCAFEVMYCNSYLASYHHEQMQATFPESPWWGGSSFWMRRRQT
jgi:hypothetical protein